LTVLDNINIKDTFFITGISGVGTSSFGRDNYLLACNFAEYSPIVDFFLTGRLNNKPFLIWLLTIPPHLKYVTTVPCNLFLIACFLTLMFHKVVWQHTKGLLIFNNHFAANLLGNQPMKEF